MLNDETGKIAKIQTEQAIYLTDDTAYKIKELENKVSELEYEYKVIWRWCLINSILLFVAIAILFL